MGRLPAVTSLSDAAGTDPEATGPRHSARRNRRERRRDERERQRSGWSELTIDTRAPAGGRLEFDLPTVAIDSRSDGGPAMFRQRKRYIEFGTVFAALVALATLGLVGVLVYQGTRVHLDETGVKDGDVITTLEAGAVELRVEFSSTEVAEGITLSYDGAVVEEPAIEGKTLVWRPPAPPPEGDHRIELEVPRPVLDDAHFQWDFTVDGTAPALVVPTATDPVGIDEPAEVSGVVEEGARLTADDERVRVADDGAFTLEFDRPPAGPVTLAAVDRAGNATTVEVVIPITYPALRGVHVTAAAWGNQQLRDGVLAMIDEGRIDTVQLDLKDDSGVVGFDTNVARAQEIGAVVRHYDLDSAITTLDNRGVRVVGRIVTFRDPALAEAAWAAGQGDQVIQTARGELWDTSGPYTNPASAAVRRYNLDIALDAVNRGVDDILWTDTRLPTGDLETIIVPGLAGSPSDAVTGFLAEAHSELRRRGAYQGVTVEGEAADLGDPVGQDVTLIARNADYVAPEIFPGYWGNDRYGVADPRRQPGDLVRGVLGRYQQATAGTGAVLVPWLQDFAARGVDFGDAEVRAQIDAARSMGVERFLLWSPSVRYHAGAVDPVPR
jgi:hypothetical protein